MKRIAYMADGQLHIISPAPGARLAKSLVDSKGKVVRVVKTPIRADEFMRGWPVQGYSVQWAESEAAFLERIKAKDVPANAAATRILEEEDIPPDRTFRNAWHLTGTSIGVDMVRAREILKARLREIRKPILEALDVEYQRADENGATDEKRRIAARKQALRDVTADPKIEAAKTPEELKAVLPVTLSAR